MSKYQQSKKSNQGQPMTEETNQAPMVIEQPIIDNTIEQPVVETVAAVVVPTPVPEESVVVTAAAVPEVKEEVVRELTKSEQELLDALNVYGVKMAPRTPIGEDEGARQQYVLWNTIERVLNGPPTEFRNKWRIILDFADASPAFGDIYINRFSEYWQWSLESLKCLQSIINLIKMTCNPARRTVGLKLVSIDKTMNEGFSPVACQNIFTFYGR